MIRKFYGLKKNNRGQLAIESVLLLSVLVGLFFTVSNTIKEKKVISRLFEPTIGSVKNMTAYGTWKESCLGLGSGKRQQKLSNCHPNSINRALSSNPN